ncbi:sigma-70 family RNA polymerase sigma factor [Pandoraea sputorum]|uniref:sigma-70 family RNA polymerase sigma factor n=1 Tax=Pandoraea sputorum TaxID=93222 RepID=UPI001E3933B6|nr:sigma-70 family RNA polymerase sigma factor [Pandoraea sputorum]MCE4063439.1 sigma-70 family RNA polymerase sigma factor [Pandoraea sputorum]
MASSEAELREQVAGLYVDHYSWLTGWIRRKLGDASIASDLAQDAFVSIIHTGAVAGIREPRPFLATVARRLLSHYYRREALETSYLELLAELPQEHMPPPEVRLIALQTLSAIDRALDGLPAKVKEAFLLAHLLDLKYSEIAERLNVSSSSVKQYLLRANRQCVLTLLD